MKRRRQGLLTAGKEVCSGVLERLEGLIDLEGLTEGLGALWSDAVAPETASERHMQPSAAADSKERGVWRRT